MHGFLQKITNEEIKHIGLHPISQSSFRKLMRDQFLIVAILKKNFFARYNECIIIQDKLKGDH